MEYLCLLGWHICDTGALDPTRRFSDACVWRSGHFRHGWLFRFNISGAGFRISYCRRSVSLDEHHGPREVEPESGEYFTPVTA